MFLDILHELAWPLALVAIALIIARVA